MSKLQYGYKLINKLPVLTKSLPIVPPVRNQVLVKIMASGLCHSDLHLLDELKWPYTGFVMGHEIAGQIHQVGDGVSDLKVGDRVVVYGPNGCNKCGYCKQGQENLCVGNTEEGMFGLGYDGGFQQYLLVRNPSNLVKIPPNVSFETAAVTTDAVLTPYHAIKQAKLSPTTHALFIGCGGLGLNSIQIAKAFGSKITVVDKKPEALTIAKQFGADETYETLPESIPPLSFDAVIDFVNIQPTFDMSMKYVKKGGVIVPVGLGAQEITVDVVTLMANEPRILGSFWGTKKDLEECLELVDDGRVTPKVTTFSLPELEKCIETLKAGKIEGRIVLLPSELE